MAKKQTRRTISVRGTTYARLMAYAHAEGTSASEAVERLLAPVLAERERAYQAGVDRALSKFPVPPAPAQTPARPVPTEEQKQAAVARALDMLSGRERRTGRSLTRAPRPTAADAGPLEALPDAEDFEAPFDEREARAPTARAPKTGRAVGADPPPFGEVPTPGKRSHLAPVIPPAAKPGAYPAPEGRDDPARSGRGAEARVKVQPAKAVEGRGPRNVRSFG